MSDAFELIRRTTEWSQWDREQYAELCEHAEEWLQGSPFKLPWHIDSAVGPSGCIQVIVKNIDGQSVVWRGVDNGSYASRPTAEYIIRALNFFPMALWATIQHNNDAAQYWREYEQYRAQAEARIKALEAEIQILKEEQSGG